MVLSQLPRFSHPDLLVGIETGDDAAVYRITDDLALVQTVDFFPPIVDDPYAYGAIAVANSLSDIYAMGATPILALNIVGFPVSLDKSILTAVLRGGYDKAAEAHVLIAGGHTVDDAEPKYGLAVTGIVRPGEQVTNAGAKPQDALVLTKPIGTGIITTGAKAGLAPQAVVDGAVAQMAALNAAASEAMQEVGVHACTDVTGFGLIGHLRGMAAGSGVAARVHLHDVPVLDGAWDLLAQDVAPGGTRRNLDSVGNVVHWDEGILDDAKLLLCDAQTSGGLLMALPPDRVESLLSALSHRGVTGWRIGEMLGAGETSIDVKL